MSYHRRENLCLFNRLGKGLTSDYSLSDINNRIFNTLFPDVFAVISSPSKIGTPLLTRVPSVLVNFATATLLRSIPNIGSLSNIQSVIFFPFSVLPKLNDKDNNSNNCNCRAINPPMPAIKLLKPLTTFS